MSRAKYNHVTSEEDCQKNKLNKHFKWQIRYSNPPCPVWLNGWMFVYELSSCWFESRCYHLKFSYGTSIEQEIAWYSGNYRVKIHSEMRLWHDSNIQSVKQTLFKVPIKDNHIVLVSLFPTLNNVRGHVKCLKFRNIQFIQRYK